MVTRFFSRGVLGLGLGLTLAAAATEEAAHVASALVWKTKRIEQVAELGQARTEAVFSFHNPSTEQVMITSVESSCGCTTAKLAKAVYGPGESGEIRALFEFQDRTGPQQKVLTVYTDDADVATQLVLRVDIPDPLVLDGTVVQWERGEAPAAKLLTARPHSAEVVISGLHFDATQVDAQFAPAAAGGGYTLTLRPLKTDVALRQSVRVDLSVAGQERSRMVYVFVR